MSIFLNSVEEWVSLPDAVSVLVVSIFTPLFPAVFEAELRCIADVFSSGVGNAILFSVVLPINHEQTTCAYQFAIDPPKMQFSLLKLEFLLHK